MMKLSYALTLGIVVAAASCSSSSDSQPVSGGGGDAGPDSTAPGNDGGDLANCTAPGAMMCSGGCTDTNTDSLNCGNCDSPCPSGTTCSDGACHCPGEQILCGQSCFDSSSDPSNCGGCAHTCLGAACQGGLCPSSPVAKGSDVGGIAADMNNLFFTNGGPGGTVAVHALNGDASVPLATGLDDPRGVASDIVHAYWADYASGTVMGATIADGGVFTLIPADDAGPSGPTSVAVDQTNIYVLDATRGSISESPLAGDSPVVPLATGRVKATALTVDATNVYWIESGSGAMTGSVNVVPIVHAGAVTQLVTGESAPAGIATDANNVYYTTSGTGGAVKMVPISGGTPETLADSQANPAGVAVDGTNVYWANTGDGTVMRVPVAGGPSVILATGQNAPTLVTLSGDYVYWLNSGTGEIRKVAK